MPVDFNFPRKQLIREQWNAPLLRRISGELNIKYLYCGLPGRDILDILVWQEMIGRIIAFQAEDTDADDPRASIKEMTRKLALLGIPYQVYCGYAEETVILGSDDEGRPYEQDDLVTLYNLDFCNQITATIPRPDGGKRCWRFEALRHLLALQRQSFLDGKGSRFVLLLTCRDDFHLGAMRSFLETPDPPNAVEAWVRRASEVKPLGDQPTQRNTPLLKAFVFTTLRTYARGVNVSTHFLPMVRYFGRTRRSRMLHFSVLCRFGRVEQVLPPGEQSAKDFLELPSPTTDDDGTEFRWCGLEGLEPDGEPPNLLGAAAAFLLQN